MSSVEERIAKLENAVFGKEVPRKKDWQKTIGRFRDDPIMDQIIDGALRARDDERAEMEAERQVDSE